MKDKLKNKLKISYKFYHIDHANMNLRKQAWKILTANIPSLLSPVILK